MYVKKRIFGQKEEKRMADKDAHIAVKDLTLAYGS
jgi:hypothetical protein